MHTFFILMAFASVATDAQGVATIIDGDTIKIGGQKIRLYGIDATESRQVCKRNRQPYDCGREAANKLAAITVNKTVVCKRKATDRYGRMVGICFAGGTELNQWMVQQGLALPYLQYGGARYKPDQQQAIKLKRGLYAGTYQIPWEYRKNKNSPYVVVRSSIPKPRPRLSPQPTAKPSSRITYSSCSEARAAGAAPVYVGTPGYSRELDRDGDGVACE